MLLEALACKIPVLIRDIPIYSGWFEDGKNIYKAKTLDEFEEKVRKIVEHELPDLTEQGYLEAKKRDIKEIGKELKKVYEKVMTLDTVENK